MAVDILDSREYLHSNELFPFCLWYIEEIATQFSSFGMHKVDWPHKAQTDLFPPKGQPLHAPPTLTQHLTILSMAL